MFGLGMMEIGLIIALAVMLFPPTELPKLARSVARIYGQVRKTAEDFRSAVLEDEDLRSPIDEIKGAYNDARWEVRDAERKARQQLAKAQMDLRMATARRLQTEREKELKDKASAEAAPGSAVVDEAGSPKSDEAPTVAGAASPVRIAVGEPEDRDTPDDLEHERASGPVAGSDPRLLTARRPPTFTPPKRATTPDEVTGEAIGDKQPSESGEAREGVA